MFILKQLARRSIRDKLIMGFSLIFLLMVIIVATSIVLVSRIERNSNVVKNISFPQALKSLEIESLITQIVYGIDYSRGSATMEGMEKAKKGKEELNNEFRLIKESFSGNDFILDIISNIENNFKEFYALGEEIVKYNIYQEWGKIPPLIERYDKLHATLLEDVSKLKQGGVDGLNDAVNNINLITRYTKRINVIMGVIGLVFIVFLTFIISLSIIKPIGMLRNLMMKAGSGDLTEKYGNEYLEKCWLKTKCNNAECQSFESGNLRCWQISGTFSSNDEEDLHRQKKIDCIECEVYKRATHDEIAIIGEAFNNMINGLKKIFAQVKKSVKAVALASGEITDISTKISEGSQSQSKSIGEVSSSINEMDTIIKDMTGNVENLSTAAEESTSSILEMSSSIDQVAGSAESLSTNVDETSSSIEEMTVSIKEVSSNVDALYTLAAETSSAITQIDASIKQVQSSAVEANKLSDQVTKSVAEEGKRSVRTAIEGMKKIRDVVLQSAGVIKKLGDRSEDIGEILTVIDDVAEQTNLLALNAAIIAAQAGEHGRGFAVVADEIRELAERTTSSTKEIANLIKSVQLESKNAVSAMEEGSKSAEEGVKLIDNVDGTFSKVIIDSEKSAEMSKAIAQATLEQAKSSKQIAESADKVAQMAEEIARATKEQTRGGEQIIKAVENMRDMSVQVKKATVEQSKGAKQITQVSEDATDMARNILKATKEEAKGSALIVRSIENVKEITSTNLDVLSKLDEMVNTLNEQSNISGKEIEKFKIEK